MEANAAFTQPDLDQLLRDHGSTLRTVCARFASREDEIDDIFQDTLLEIVRNYGSFRGESSFMTWAARVAFSQANRHRRRRRRFSVRDGAIAAVANSMPSYFSSDLADPERATEGAQNHAQVGRALERLNPLDREVFVLRELEGFTTQEVSEKLGLSAAAVKSRLHRARAGVRKSVLREQPFAAAMPGSPLGLTLREGVGAR